MLNSAFAKILQEKYFGRKKKHAQRQILCKKISAMRHYDGSGNSSEHFPNNKRPLGWLYNRGKYAADYDDIHAVGTQMGDSRSIGLLRDTAHIGLFLSSFLGTVIGCIHMLFDIGLHTCFFGISKENITYGYNPFLFTVYPKESIYIKLVSENTA